MSVISSVLNEPLLEFGKGQKIEHPKDGLFLYGPLEIKGRPKEVNVGVIGPRAGIALLGRWLETLAGYIPAEKPDKLHSFAWPGFEATFGAKLVTDPIVKIEIPLNQIESAAKKGNRTDAVRSMVKLYEEAISNHLREEEARPDVWMIVVPEIVHDYGRPEMALPKDKIKSSLMSEKTAADILSNGSLFTEMEEEAQTYLFAKNFHHQLKAQLLEKEVIIQIVRETTLDPTISLDHFGNPKRAVQDRTQIAWNFSTTLYFKARGHPWQLADVRPGVCYVGLVFKEDPSPAKRGEACCAAQMFLNSGNGVVFRGALGPWYSDKTKEFHLSTEASCNLVAEVIRAYTKDHGCPPKELFIHGRHRFSEEEWKGFELAVPQETKLVGVRIRPSQELRLFRPKADVPVLRGTAVAMTDKEGYLWTTGYTPRLGTYPGFETPKPILVEITGGYADLMLVMQDVLALTKINYNACNFSSGIPVTLKFADRVGEILTASPNALRAPPLPFRYYI